MLLNHVDFGNITSQNVISLKARTVNVVNLGVLLPDFTHLMAPVHPLLTEFLFSFVQSKVEILLCLLSYMLHIYTLIRTVVYTDQLKIMSS